MTHPSVSALAPGDRECRGFRRARTHPRMTLSRPWKATDPEPERTRDGVRGSCDPPRDGCTADVCEWPGAVRTPTVVSEGPKRGVRFNLCECVPDSETVSGEQRSTPRPAHAAGRRLSHRGDPSGERGSILPGLAPGRLFGEQGSILCSRSRIRGREPSRFLGAKRWKARN